MNEISSTEINANLKPIFKKAQDAFKIKNYGYVFVLCKDILKSHPNCTEIRRFNRAAAIEEYKKHPKNKLSSTLSGFAFGMSKKDPLETLFITEEALASDPFNDGANAAQAESARILGWNDLKSLALETLAHSGNVRSLNALAQHFMEINVPEKAIKIYEMILKSNPSDGDALRGVRQSQASDVLKNQKWDEATSYRDVLKNKDEAMQLEKESANKRTDNAVLEEMHRIYSLWEKDNSNLDLVRKLALLNEEVKNFADAVAWWEYRQNIQFDQSIESRIRSIQANDGNETDRLELLKSSVAKNPTDPQLHLELGEEYVKNNDFSNAIPELQKAKTGPHQRIKACFCLAKAYIGKKMNDLAEIQLSSLLKEVNNNPIKKDVLYELANVREVLGKKTEALDALKEIYQEDYAFKDVAQRVENAYI